MKVRKCLSCSGDDGLWRSICVTIPGTVIRVGSGLYQIPPTSSALTVPHFPLLSNFPHSMCSPIPIVPIFSQLFFFSFYPYLIPVALKWSSSSIPVVRVIVQSPSRKKSTVQIPVAVYRHTPIPVNSRRSQIPPLQFLKSLNSLLFSKSYCSHFIYSQIISRLLSFSDSRFSP